MRSIIENTGGAAVCCQTPRVRNFSTTVACFENQIVQSALLGVQRQCRATLARRFLLESLRASTDELQTVQEIIREDTPLERSLRNLDDALRQMDNPLHNLRQLLLDRQPLADRPIMLEQAVTENLPFSLSITLDPPALVIHDWNGKLANVRFEIADYSSPEVSVWADARVTVIYTGTDEAPHQLNITAPIQFDQRFPEKFPSDATVQGWLSVTNQRLSLTQSSDPPQTTAVTMDLTFQRITSVLVPGDAGGINRAIGQIDILDQARWDAERALANLEQVAEGEERLKETVDHLIRSIRDRLREITEGIR